MYMYELLHVCICLCIRICIYIYTHKHMCSIYMYTCTHTHIDICIYTHTSKRAILSMKLAVTIWCRSTPRATSLEARRSGSFSRGLSWRGPCLTRSFVPSIKGMQTEPPTSIPGHPFLLSLFASQSSLFGSWACLLALPRHPAAPRCPPGSVPLQWGHIQGC